MNAPIWNDYIAQYTRPTVPLAIVPKATQAASPVSPVIKCAVRLPDKYVFRDGQLIDIREQWSHCAYECVVGVEWVLILYGTGRLWRRRKDVRLSVDVVEVAQKKIA